MAESLFDPIERKRRNASKHREWILANKDKVRAHNASYYQRHKPECLTKCNRRYHDNREKILPQMRNYYAANKDRIIAQTRVYVVKNRDKVLAAKRVYYQKNKLKLRPAKRQWAIRNPEKIREGNRIYKEKNREKVRANANRYVKQRKTTDPNFKIRCLLRSRLNAAIDKNCKKSSASVLLGCPIPDFKIYLESLFEPGMSWENHGTIWEIDHILPCALFDLTREDHQQHCFHFSNHQPLWKPDNRKKWKHLPKGMELPK